MPGRSTGLVALLGLAFVVSQAHLGHVLGPLSPNIVSVQLTFDSRAFWETMAVWGPEGMARLRATLLPWDILHPFIYGAFGYALVTRTGLFRTRGPWQRALTWALPVAALCDQVENACELYLLSLPFGTPSVAIPIGAGFSTAKWTIAVVFAMLFAAAAVAALVRLLKPR